MRVLKKSYLCLQILKNVSKNLYIIAGCNGAGKTTASFTIFLKVNENVNFAFETTLSTKTHKNTILQAQATGYNVTLLFFWLQTVELARQRVQKRVSEGGHDIEPEVIERRYLSGIRNLFDIYLLAADEVLIFDNSEGKHELIAKKINQSDLSILNNINFNLLKQYYDNQRTGK